jgi:hypothetical protein
MQASIGSNNRRKDTQAYRRQDARNQAFVVEAHRLRWDTQPKKTWNAIGQLDVPLSGKPLSILDCFSPVGTATLRILSGHGNRQRHAANRSTASSAGFERMYRAPATNVGQSVCCGKGCAPCSESRRFYSGPSSRSPTNALYRPVAIVRQVSSNVSGVRSGQCSGRTLWTKS